MSDLISKKRKREGPSTSYAHNMGLSQHSYVDWFNIQDLWLMTSSVSKHTMNYVLSRCSPKLITLRINCCPYELEDVVSIICCYKYPKLEWLRFAVEKGYIPNIVKQYSDAFMLQILSVTKRLVYLYLYNWKYLTGVGFIHLPLTLRYLYLEKCKRISRTVLMCLSKDRDLRYMPMSILSDRYSYDLISVLCKIHSFTSYSISRKSRHVIYAVQVSICAPDDVGLLRIDDTSRQYMTSILVKLLEEPDCWDWAFLMNLVLYHIHGYCVLEPIDEQGLDLRDIFNPLLKWARTLDCRNLYDLNRYSFRQIVANCKNLRKVYISNCPLLTFQNVCKAVKVKNHPFPLVITLNDVPGPAGIKYKELDNNVTVRFRQGTNPVNDIEEEMYFP